MSHSAWETPPSASVPFCCASPQDVVAVADGLRPTQQRLSRMPLDDIVAALDTVAHGWLDPKTPFRQEAEARLAAAGQADPDLLAHLFSQLTRPALVQLLEEELGDPGVLDDFVPRQRGAGRTRAFGPGRILHILPSHVPDVAILGLVCALLTKSASLARVNPDRAVLLTFFLRSLERVQPALAACCAIVTWARARVDITRAAFENVEAAIVYGNDETLNDLRPLIPARTHVLFHGHKVSLGVVARECAQPAVAEATARDVMAHNQRGCLSPHVYYVESGGVCPPMAFAGHVAQALDGLCRASSARRAPLAVHADEAAHIWQWRGALPLKGGRVFQSGDGINWTVLYDPDPTFVPSPLGCTIWIKPIEDWAALRLHLQPIAPHLQAVGVAVPAERLGTVVAHLAEMGVCRICPIGWMQRPPLTWHYDGRFRLLDLLRFVDWETA